MGDNAAHGKQRTSDDKRRAVMTLLEDAEWAAWSDREIARRCRVTHWFVGKCKASLDVTSSDSRTYTTRHGTVATMETAGISAANAQRAEGAAGLESPLAQVTERSAAACTPPPATDTDAPAPAAPPPAPPTRWLRSTPARPPPLATRLASRCARSTAAVVLKHGRRKDPLRVTRSADAARSATAGTLG